MRSRRTFSFLVLPVLSLLGATALLAWGESQGSGRLRVPVYTAGGRVELVAGAGNVRDGGKAIEAVITGVAGLAADREGNLYFSDSGHGRVRKIDARTGTISTVAGNGLLISEESSLLATEQALRTPGPLALDAEKGLLYVGEVAGRRVQRIDLASGTAQELPVPEGGGFGKISGLVWTPTGLVVADAERGQILKLVRSLWIDMLPAGAELRGGIRSLARDGVGHLYLSEPEGHRVLKLDTNSGQLTPYLGTGQAGKGSGGGPAAATAITAPDGLAFDAAGNLLVADLGNQRILEVNGQTGEATVRHQSTAAKGSILEWSPGSLALDGQGNLWLGDVHRDRVLRFVVGATQPDVIAGGAGLGDGGPATAAHLAQPGSVVADRRGNVYISDTLHHRVRVVEAESGSIRTLVGTGSPGFNGDGLPGAETRLAYPAQLQLDEAGRLYIGDDHNHRVRLYDPATDKVSTLAGNGEVGEAGDGGPAKDASLSHPYGIYLDGPDTLVVASAVSSTLRRIDLRSGRIWHVPLQDPTVPADRVIQGLGRWDGMLLLAMPRPSPGSIDLLSRTGKLTRLFSAPDVESPYGAAVSPEEELFVCDTGRNQVLRWTGRTMEVVAEGLGQPRAISFDPRGNLLVADTLHNRVLRILLHEPPGVLASNPPATFASPSTV